MLPRHDDIGVLRRIVEASCITMAVVLWAIHATRFVANWSVASWWAPVLILMGMAAADLTSGIVHWAADTWGRESMPIIGRRLLHPFRVHHVNPADFLRRDFLDANGDVAIIVILLQAAMLWIPLAGSAGHNSLAFMLGFTSIGLWTNQIHQWAHTPSPPGPIRLLQAWGIILSYEAHLRHHREPHVTDYCIVSGWCNGVLNRSGFFRRLEAAITWATGYRPRDDEESFSVALFQSQTPGSGEAPS